MSETIICPQCQADIEVTEVMSAQLAMNIRRELQAEYAVKARQLTDQRQELVTLREQLDAQCKDFDKHLKEAVRAECDEIAAKSLVEAQQEVALEIQDRDAQLAAVRSQLKAFEVQELELRKKARQLQEKAERQELELARRLDEERGKIRDAALKQADEQTTMRLAEQQLKIDALARQLQDAQRRLEQGSQQAQGDVQEMALESLLTTEFPNDVIERVGKGVNGGDVIHHVFDRNGRECGIILWESKRTKSWSDKWIGKALDDQQEAKATCTCIVTAVMPNGIEHIGEMGGVWVTSWACARGAAVAIRRVLIEAAQARITADGQHGKMELIYNYVAGPEFKNRFIGLITPYIEMEVDLRSEMRALNARWKKRRKQLDRMMMSTTGLYGDFQGIIGASLQRIEEMELLAIEGDGCIEPPMIEAD